MDFAERYSRQILFPPIGAEGQTTLAAARIAIVGCGATGSALASSAGPRRRRLSAHHRSRLRRAQQPAAPGALRRVRCRRVACPRPSPPRARSGPSTPKFAVEPHSADLNPSTSAKSLLGGVDLILDGTDNFETRYLINDFAVSKSVPWIYTAAVASYGGHHDRAARRDCLPGLCLSRFSPRHWSRPATPSGILNSAVNLVASIACDRSHEAAGRRARQAAPHAALVRRLDATTTPKSAPPSRARIAGPASSTTSCISPAKGVRTSRSAGATRCRFTSASVPSTSPK